MAYVDYVMAEMQHNSRTLHAPPVLKQWSVPPQGHVEVYAVAGLLFSNDVGVGVIVRDEFCCCLGLSSFQGCGMLGVLKLNKFSRV